MSNPIQSHLILPNFDVEEKLYGNPAKRFFSNVGFDDNVGIWEGSIIYKVMYFVFEVEEIFGFVARFLVVVAIFIEVPSGRYGIRHGCRV